MANGDGKQRLQNFGESSETDSGLSCSDTVTAENTRANAGSLLDEGCDSRPASQHMSNKRALWVSAPEVDSFIGGHRDDPAVGAEPDEAATRPPPGMRGTGAAGFGIGAGIAATAGMPVPQKAAAPAPAVLMFGGLDEDTVIPALSSSPPPDAASKGKENRLVEQHSSSNTAAKHPPTMARQAFDLGLSLLSLGRQAAGTAMQQLPGVGPPTGNQVPHHVSGRFTGESRSSARFDLTPQRPGSRKSPDVSPIKAA